MKFEEMINTIQLGDCYEMIKNIPDKSIDLIYTDIPYEYESGGKGGNSFIISDKVKETYHEKIDKFAYGIDYSIFNEMCRIMKNIYIYMVFKRSNITDNKIFCRAKRL